MRNEINPRLKNTNKMGKRTTSNYRSRKVSVSVSDTSLLVVREVLHLLVRRNLRGSNKLELRIKWKKKSQELEENSVKDPSICSDQGDEDPKDT
ncbi:Uncharacterized protein TCM_003852 [Theobroma cacao]|uniref:Uncharacterized protein n=1 Tax=Theobroma cacao TaxID=3641 RepID=A0A061DWA0_THECC|nr:Uncharacterized protein TCM_003852 [Theobroma cacao]